MNLCTSPADLPHPTICHIAFIQAIGQANQVEFVQETRPREKRVLKSILADKHRLLARFQHDMLQPNLLTRAHSLVPNAIQISSTTGLPETNHK